jgi:hypothetical protein
VRLKNPGSAKAAIDTVKEVKGALLNAYGTSNDRKTALLNWCNNWATPQLGNHFPATEELFALISDTYNRLALAPDMPRAHLNGLLHREWQEWDTRLDRLIAELGTLLAFTSRPGAPVVLDTSALMEGVPFTDFDWHTLHPSLAGVPVRLIVPILVIEELDELKRPHRREREKAQARKVLKALWDLHRAAPASPSSLPASPEVTIEVFPDGDWHTRRPNNDGEIIDQAVAVKEATGKDVILAACDYTQLYRAAPAGLSVIEMPRQGVIDQVRLGVLFTFERLLARPVSD